MGTLLSISLAGLRRDDPAAPWAAGPRAAIAWAATLGPRAIQLDATAPGLRPRDLDRSARRDLASLVRRHELALTGLDLFIPGEHLLDPAHVDRAVSAINAAASLAAELAPLAASATGAHSVVAAGRLVSLMLPAGITGDVVSTIAAEADRQGVRLADHAWPPGPKQAGSSARAPESVRAPAPMIVAGGASPAARPSHPEPQTPAAPPPFPPAIGIGLDPAAVALASDDIGSAAARVADRALTARLCDLSSAGRVLPGSADGRLDIAAYKVALSLAPHPLPVVIDLRGLHEQVPAARRMIDEWNAV